MPNTIAENLQRLQTAKTAIGNAITAKGGTVSSGDGLEEFAADIATIPSGGGGSQSRKDVNFYDYDGTIVNSYTAAEFAELAAMPANPTHDGLTAQGWNWSFADAKAYVASYGKLEIGQMYITSDGKTRLYITLPEGRTSPVLQLYLNANSELDIDWGDGSAHSTFTSTSAEYKSERHNYASAGDYVIVITVTNGAFSFRTVTGYKSVILTPSEIYLNTIKEVRLGVSVTIGAYGLSSCYSLSSIALPNRGVITDKNAFSLCISLKAIIIPNPSISLFEAEFRQCYSLEVISLPSTVQSMGLECFSTCYALSSITLPNSLSAIGNYAFTNCQSLSSITIPNSVSNIAAYAFSDCRALSSITIPNSVSSINNYVFSGCQSLSSITIPNSVSSINNYVFQNCYALSSITIPNLTTYIGNGVFDNCSNIIYIRFKPTVPPSVSTNSWYRMPSSVILCVPINFYDNYISANNYPSPSSYLYLVYATYSSGDALPSTSTDNYNLTWYASMDDAAAETNPITVGNDNEIYARCTPIT